MFRPCEGNMPIFQNADRHYGTCLGTAGTGAGIDRIGLCHASRNVFGLELSRPAINLNG